ncbi:MAG: hypothetical protein A3H68_03240 [Candidatus Taylorbacteria bacterium RIFCSPLOWO2_02_FULL_46_40]|uniref:Uncharacterized protein n=1 Tax=Candidatus Taylorbacteria bacterium RIFCSPLOWO2_02_FULL_46_40 TaxID=1802329 RepID=A0A1G2P3F6_9BACT|nr:MAG: hypothetical protein A3H68_03240 [Candidatus Taylorbacteria bacterium RIFCSPLOWO2_02_FULL_46_40]
MKTILISSFHTLVSRNILNTPVLKMLQKEARVVVLAPYFKRDYFLKNFGSEKVEIVGLKNTLTAADLFFRFWALAASKTRGLYIKRRAKLYQEGNLFLFLSAVLPSRLGVASRSGIKLLRWCNRLFFGRRNGPYRDLFNNYKPDLVFSTDIQNELDVRMLEEAKHRGIKTVGMIRSWDNLSTKGVIRVVPDILLAHNEIIKGEADVWNFIPDDKIISVGIPHHDRYQTQPSVSRQEFLKKFGFRNINRRLILVAPVGNRYIRENKLDQNILEILSKFDANVLVRLPPSDHVSYNEINNPRSQIIFDRTGSRFEGKNIKLNEVDESSDVGLWCSLWYADVVVTGQSTIALDAALCGKGSVIVDFDDAPRVYWDSVRRYYDYEYYDNIRKTGGVIMAKSPAELVILVKKYLADPVFNRDARNKMILEQEYRLDGRSSERLSNVLLKELK